ncbi:MAG: hypothetical protein ABF811_08045 [Pseudoclavibacter sp.]|jgi:hypothetical protein
MPTAKNLDAAEIFFTLQQLKQRLEQLSDSGRITMATTRDNTDYRSTGKAVRAASAALQTALDATRWMVTLPTGWTDGEMES